MNQNQLCPIHNQPWKTVPGGISKKTGKPYNAFQACPQMGCTEKPPKDNTPMGQFERSLDNAASNIDVRKKDDTISRLAICKEFIARGDHYTFETVREMEKFLAWAQGRSVKIEPEPAPVGYPEDEVNVDDVNFS